MKTSRKTLLILNAIFMLFFTQISAQDEAAKEEKPSPFSVGADLVSNYVWRGTKLAGPSFQPTVKFTVGGFSAGAWGSIDFSSGYSEVDPFISYSMPFGLTLTVNDYYLSSLDFTKTDTAEGSHGLELSAAYSIKGFSLNGNYIVNEAGGLGTVGGDTYIQLGYTYKNFNLFVGGGNGWYTLDNEFKFCNVGLGANKEIVVTETFKIPVFGQLIYNPDRKQMHIVVGFSF